MILYHGSNVEIEAIDFANDNIGMQMRKIDADLITWEQFVKELALRLMEERGLTMKQALDTVYNSETYTKVLDLRTGLYSQSTAYVYSILETEIPMESLQYAA